MTKYEPHFSATDVVSALESERGLARINGKHIEVVTRNVVDGKTSIVIRLLKGNSSAEDIDELDGMPVRWAAMPIDARPTISVVDADRSLIQLRGKFRGPYPEVGTVIQQREQDFYGPVIALWQRDDCSKRFLAQLERFHDEQAVKIHNLIDHKLALSLFKEQAAALGIIDYSTSYIWGTGGAGKTQTLTTLIRALVSTYPAARILVCATSNKGVDEVVLRLAHDAYGAFRLKRYGPSYDKAAYEKYPALLPDADDELISDANREYPFDEEDVVLPSGIYAFTVVSALCRFDRLAEHEWDLVIADEASQIPLSHILPIMSLSKKALFVGDPEQCSPVAKTSNAAWREITGTSAFKFIPPLGDRRMVMLARQARMPEIISAWAGREFYAGKLKLAHEVANTPQWQAFRRRSFAGFGEDQHMVVIDIPSSSVSRRERCIRESSARMALELIQSDDSQQFNLDEIAFITPFNGQANLFRSLMREAGLHSVVSSTSHKLQGSQFPLVFLDPVYASGAFMRSVIGRQILNVGATRAQCKLLWLVSEDDLTNPWLTHLREFAARSNQLLGQE